MRMLCAAVIELLKEILALQYEAVSGSPCTFSPVSEWSLECVTVVGTASRTPREKNSSCCPLVSYGSLISFYIVGS